MKATSVKVKYYKGFLLIGSIYLFMVLTHVKISDDQKVNELQTSFLSKSQSYKFSDSVSEAILNAKNIQLISGNTNIKYEKLFLAENDLLKTPEIVEEPKTFIKDNLNFARIRINSNIYSDARNASIPQRVICQLIDAYKYLVNFQSDVKNGNILTILFSNSGELKYASLSTKRKKLIIYGYKSNNTYKFYNENGESIKSFLFQQPITGARISSKFGKRLHPIYHRIIPHKGIDFAAPPGTPITCASDGKVVQIGKLGGYGNCITIIHANGFKTRYGHMSRYNKNIFVGSFIKQGQVIGFVGKTGKATGNHLHFEVIKNGRHINPMSAQLVSKKINFKDREKFTKMRKEIDRIISSKKTV